MKIVLHTNSIVLYPLQIVGPIVIGECRTVEFSEDGKPDQTTIATLLEPRHLSENIEQYGAAVSFIERLLTIEPTNRPSAMTAKTFEFANLRLKRKKPSLK